MSERRPSFLKKAHIEHLARATSGITGETDLVLVGTGAVIACLRNVPLEMMQTRELDIQVPDDDAGNRLADLVDGSIGEGSQFDATFGYYAHAIMEGTAQLPSDWRQRAQIIPIAEGLRCVCPEPSDIALSKIAAWREKDVTWLRLAAPLFLDVQAMRRRLPEMPRGGVGPAELDRRMAVVEGFAGTGRSAPEPGRRFRDDDLVP